VKPGWSLWLAALLAVVMGGPALAECAGEAGPCTIATGTYNLRLPEGAAESVPALMFLHGWGGSGDGTMDNTGMVETVLARGFAVIAPDGMPREGRAGRSWSFHPDLPAARDETAFLKAVADDAATRFGIDRSRILLGGFSIGGSMVSYLACADPGAFAAYAPVAGSFWRPHPAGCAGPVKLLHTHGWTDVTVPLEGRNLGSGASQGDVFQAMQIWRATNGCTRMLPDAFGEDGVFWLRRWTRCTPGSALEFALHPGAHGVPKGWATLALDWFARVENSQPD
jgi:polyhydroxybutyrate depolymerase